MPLAQAGISQQMLGDGGVVVCGPEQSEVIGLEWATTPGFPC